MNINKNSNNDNEYSNFDKSLNSNIIGKINSKNSVITFIDKLNKSKQNIINLLLQFATYFMVENVSNDKYIKQNWLDWEWPEDMNKCIFTIWKILEKHGAGSSLFKIYFNDEYQNDINRVWILELFVSLLELFFDSFVVNNNKNDNILICTLNSSDLESVEFKLFNKWWSVLNEYTYFNNISDTKIYVRYLWLKYQYEYLIGNIEEAIYYLSLILKQEFNEIIYHNARYIKKLTPSIVKLHICMINASQYINETKFMYSSKNYQEIILHLRKLFDDFFISDNQKISQEFHNKMENWNKDENIQLTSESELYHSILLEYINKSSISVRYQLLELLRKSYKELNKSYDEFICLIYMLIDITRNIETIENKSLILKYSFIFSNIVKIITDPSSSDFYRKLNEESENIFYLFLSIIFLYSRIGLFFFEHSQEIYQYIKMLSKEESSIEEKFNTYILDIWILFIYTINYLKDIKIDLEQKYFKESTTQKLMNNNSSLNENHNNYNNNNSNNNNKIDNNEVIVIDNDDNNDDKKNNKIENKNNKNNNYINKTEN